MSLSQDKGLINVYGVEVFSLQPRVSAMQKDITDTLLHLSSFPEDSLVPCCCVIVCLSLKSSRVLELHLDMATGWSEHMGKLELNGLKSLYFPAATKSWNTVAF